MASDSDTPASKFKCGPKLAYDFFCTQLPIGGLPQNGLDDVGFGLTGGFAFRNEWHRKWYLESGLLMTYGHSPVDIIDTSSTHPSYLPYDMERSALILPLHLGFRFDVVNRHGMSLFLGGWGSCGMTGRLDGNGESPHHDLYGPEGVWHRFGVGVAMGFTFEISEHVSIGFDGNLGLNKMARQNVFRLDNGNESSVRIALSWWVPKR